MVAGPQILRKGDGTMGVEGLAIERTFSFDRRLSPLRQLSGLALLLACMCGGTTEDEKPNGSVSTAGAAGANARPSGVSCSEHPTCSDDDDCTGDAECWSVQGCTTPICITHEHLCRETCVGACGTMDSIPPRVTCEHELIPGQP